MTRRSKLISACAAAAVIVMGGAARSAEPVAPVAVSAPIADRLTQLDHISIEAVGSGPAVVLIPGLSTPRAVWDGVVPMLSADHTVYLVQVNGFAGGDPRANLAPGILDGIVADLHGFIAAHRLEGAPVVGHSMGGLAALMLAKAHPGDAGRLMIVDALPFIGVLFAPDATVPMIEPQAAAMRQAMLASAQNGLADAMAQQIAAQNARKPQSRTRVAEWVKAADARVSAQAMYEDLTTDLRGDIAAIATPITMLFPWSAAMPLARAEAMYHAAYADAADVRFVPIADSGHFAMLDQPAAFETALRAFVAG